MLSYEFMGLLALTILWVNTLLILAAALKQVGRIQAQARRLREAQGLRSEGEVFTKAVVSVGHPLARHVIVQAGHCSSRSNHGEKRSSLQAGTTKIRDSRAIVFHDRSRFSEVFGGVLGCVGQELSLRAGERAELWVGRREQDAASRAVAGSLFESAYPDACRPRGYDRQLNLEVSEGRNVWVFGCVHHGELRAPIDAPLLIATIDPLQFYRRKVQILLLFVLLAFVGALSCSLLSLYPPVFGLVSQVGAAASLLFFLLIQPIGVILRDFSLSPVQRPLRGRWLPPMKEQALGGIAP